LPVRPVVQSNLLGNGYFRAASNVLCAKRVIRNDEDIFYSHCLMINQVYCLQYDILGIYFWSNRRVSSILNAAIVPDNKVIVAISHNALVKPNRSETIPEINAPAA